MMEEIAMGQSVIFVVQITTLLAMLVYAVFQTKLNVVYRKRIESLEQRLRLLERYTGVMPENPLNVVSKVFGKRE